MTELSNLNTEILFHYSPYSCIPAIDKSKIIKLVTDEIKQLFVGDSDCEITTITVNNIDHHFVTRFLKWDSDYFNITTFRLKYVLYNHREYDTLKEACRRFIKKFFTDKNVYCFSEIPSEDIFTIQALNESGFKLVESRLTYYLKLKEFTNDRYQTREATHDDTQNLMRVAREMRNDYDRFHAETVFNPQKADEFLATYIEQSIKGFADYTMVPSGENVHSDAFLTSNYLKNEWEDIGLNVSKMVLSAVSSETNKGWYIKLISEMAFHLRDIGAEYAFMHPATTNKAVIHTYEKLGCKYGKCIHVLTLTN